MRKAICLIILSLFLLSGMTLAAQFTDKLAIGKKEVVNGILDVDGHVYATAYHGDGSAITGMTKSQVGLSNVDNTSDLNKPVSTATQTALNLKENTLTKGNLSSSTGISVTGGTGAVIGAGATITNTAPDQTVALTAGLGIGVAGTYPNFTITNTRPQDEETDPIYTAWDKDYADIINTPDLSVYLTDAPSNANQYARQGGNWAVVTPPITGVNWNEIGGIQSDVQVGGFSNAYGYIRNADINWTEFPNAQGYITTWTETDPVWTSEKASYATTASLSGYVPTSRTINGQALTGNITIDGMVYPASGIAKSTGTGWTTSISGTSGQFIKGDGSLDSTLYVSGTPWTSMGYLTGVVADAPLAGVGTSASHLSIPKATSSVDGYLYQQDWTKFNNKLSSYTETDPLSLHLDQTTPQTFTNLGGGTGLMKVTAGLLGLDTNTYVTGTPWTGMGYITLGSLSGTAPITYNNTTGAIGITSADATHAGSVPLSSTPVTNQYLKAAITTGALSWGQIPYADISGTPSLTGYALLDGTNQPFTGNINISKSLPDFRLTSTDAGGDYMRQYRTATTNYGYQYNRVLQPGGYGTALTFDGSTQYGYVADNVNHDIGTSNFSVSFWFKTSMTFAALTGLVGKTKYGAENGRWFFAADPTNLSISFEETVVRGISYSSTGLNNGAWHNVVATFDRTGNLTLYIDGSPVGSPLNISAYSASNWNNTCETMIGAYNNGSGGHPPQAGTYFNGSMDDIAIWKGRVLTAAEVADIWSSGTGLKIVAADTFPTSGNSMGTSLISVYNLNDASEATAVDSVSAINLTLAGTPTWTTGIIRNATTTQEGVIWSSKDGVGSLEKGITTFGDSASQTNLNYGTSANIQYAGTTQATFTSNLLTLGDAFNVAVNTTTGTKIGTATSQKIGFFNSAPVVQQTNTTEIGVALSNLGLRAAGTAYPITTSGAVNLSGTNTFGSGTGVGYLTSGVLSAVASNTVGGMTLVDTASPSAAANFTISNLAPGQKYLLKINVVQNTNSSALHTLTFNSDTGGNYFLAGLYMYGNTSLIGVYSQGQTGITPAGSGTATYPTEYEIYFTTAQGNGHNVFVGVQLLQTLSANHIPAWFSGYYKGAADLSTLTFATSTGTMTGTASLYRLN